MEKIYLSDDDFSYDEEGFADEWLNSTDIYASSNRRSFLTVLTNYSKKYLLTIIPAYFDRIDNSKFHIIEEKFMVEPANYFYLSVAEMEEKYGFNLLKLNQKIKDAMKDT